VGTALPDSYFANARGPPPITSPARTWDRSSFSRIMRMRWGVSSSSSSAVGIVISVAKGASDSVALNETPLYTYL
jgi:hypothetical protein